MLKNLKTGREKSKKLKSISKNLNFSANRFPDQPHQIFVVPSRTRIFGYFACLTFLLYSFRLDRIFTLHSLLYQDRLYTFSLFFVIIYFASLLSSCTLPAQRFELWTLKLRVSCSTKLSYTGDFQDLSCNAPDVIRTRDIRVKSPLPYRLATDAN